MFDAPTPSRNSMSSVKVTPSRAHSEPFRPWTGAEIVLLQSLRKRHTMAQIARRIGRSEWGVKAQARRLGIKKF